MDDSVQRNRKGSRLKRLLTRTVILLAFLFIIGFFAFRYSPWPSALLIRRAFTVEATRVNEAMARYVPVGISEHLNVQYDIQDYDAFLDIYYPSTVLNTDSLLPAIVWIHGGGWVSGVKEDISNYGRILAGRNLAVISVDYSIAPGAHYPTPLIQLNKALGYLKKNAFQFHIDTTHFFLAGDSGGAHIAAQTGCIISNSGYSKLLGITPSITSSQLSGLILFCGPYDAEQIDLEGEFGSFLKTVLWAYMGQKDFTSSPLFNTFSVINYVDEYYPASFISVGNADPLHVQSEALARKLDSLKIKVDTLFFAPGYTPALSHEYQFNLELEAGREALERAVLFVQTQTGLWSGDR